MIAHQWRALDWASQWRTAIDKLEPIEPRLDEFPTEDDLGTYMQVTAKWTSGAWPMGGKRK